MKYTSKLILNGETYDFAAPEQGWQLGANTIAYYPLNGDILDHKGDYGISGTTYDLSVAYGTPSYTTSFDSNKVAFNPQATESEVGGCGLSNSNSIWNFTSDFTVSFCVRFDDIWHQLTWDYTTPIAARTRYSYNWMIMVNADGELLFHGNAQYVTTRTPTIGTWYNITCTVINGIYTIYVDGTAIQTGSYIYSSGTPGEIHIGYGYDNGTPTERLDGCLSEIIIDGEGWDATKALDRAQYLGFAN